MNQPDCGPESHNSFLCDSVRFHVLAMIGERPHVLHVRETPDVFDELDALLGRDSYWVTYMGKPIRRNVEWGAYMYHPNLHLDVHPRMRGGMHAVRIRMHENYFRAPSEIDAAKMMDSVNPKFLVRLGAQTPLPWSKSFSARSREFAIRKEYYDQPRYTPVDALGRDASCTRKQDLKWLSAASQRLMKQMRKPRPEVQAIDINPKHFLERHTDPEVLSFVEDVALLCLQLLKARDNTDRALAATVFIKLRTRAPLISNVIGAITDVVTDLFTPRVQSDDDVLQSVTDLRSLIQNWESIQTSTLVQQISKVYKFTIAMGVFTLVGIKIDEDVVRKCKVEMHSPLMGVNFMVTILDTVAMMIQRVLLFKKSGKWETIFHGPQSFGKWFDACQKVKREFVHRGDLESQGTNYHTFVGDLRQCVEEGRSILKYGNIAAGMEMMGVKKLLNDMLMMQAEIATFREAQKSRRPPFGLLVYGKTCVGKSTFTSMLYQFAGKFLNLPTTDEYRYTRNTCDDFWSGWDSMKWFASGRHCIRRSKQQGC